MASTVANILTDVHYDLKLGSSDQTSRQAELISYINRVLRNGILPTLVRFESDYGMKEWTTSETAHYKRQYSLPSDFIAFNVLYCIEEEYADTLTAGSTSSLTLDADASDTDDDYNGYLIRLQAGDGDDQQATIYDYNGTTKVASIYPALGTTPGGDENFKIFKSPEESDELELLGMRELLNNYSSITSTPEAYAIERNTYVFLGGIPDSDDYVLYGLYHYMPTKLTATTDSLPYDPIFDEVVRSAVTQIGMNRDEYDTKVEMGIMSMVQQEVQMLLRYRHTEFAQSKIRGSRG